MWEKSVMIMMTVLSLTEMMIVWIISVLVWYTNNIWSNTRRHLLTLMIVWMIGLTYILWTRVGINLLRLLLLLLVMKMSQLVLPLLLRLNNPSLTWSTSPKPCKSSAKTAMKYQQALPSMRAARQLSWVSWWGRGVKAKCLLERWTNRKK